MQRYVSHCRTVVGSPKQMRWKTRLTWNQIEHEESSLPVCNRPTQGSKQHWSNKHEPRKWAWTLQRLKKCEARAARAGETLCIQIPNSFYISKWIYKWGGWNTLGTNYIFWICLVRPTFARSKPNHHNWNWWCMVCWCLFIHFLVLSGIVMRLFSYSI